MRKTPVMQDPNPRREHELMTTRRQLFGRTALGLGTAAMANLLGSRRGLRYCSIEQSAQGK